MATMQERHSEQAQVPVVPYSGEDYAGSFFGAQNQADAGLTQAGTDLIQTGTNLIQTGKKLTQTGTDLTQAGTKLTKASPDLTQVIKELSKRGPETAETKTEDTEKKKRRTDISGMRSGKLVAIERTSEKRHGSYLWRCRCDCGQETLVESYRIRRQLTKSCGCSRKGQHMAEIAGQKFGLLTALKRTDRKRGSNYLWECRCECGSTVYVTANSLISGNTKSCGCTRKKNIREMHEKKGIITDHLTLVEGTCIEKIENQSLRRDNSSGCIGVHARGNRWVASIGFKKKNYYLGIYSRLEDAVRARKDAEERLYGEFLKWYYENHPVANNPEGADKALLKKD